MYADAWFVPRGIMHNTAVITRITDPNKEYTFSLNLDDDDQLLVQKMDEDDDAEDTAELLKDLFPDFSYVKKKRKPKKD